MSRRRILLLTIVLALVIAAGATVWALGLRPIAVQVAKSSETCWSKSSALAPSRRASPPRSASRFPACWSSFAPMSATPSQRVRFSPASTTASRERRSPGQMQPSSRLKRTFKGPKQASKRQGELRQCQQYQPASADAATEQQYLGRNGTDGEGRRRRYTAAT